MRNSSMVKIICFCIILSSSLTVNAQTQKEEHLDVDGLNRKFTTYIPVINSSAYKPPLVICLHGGFGTGEGMMKWSDFRPMANRDKFIIVCPDGINRSWNDGRETKANKKGIDDVKFIDHIITYIITTYNADAGRVYITGMSNGGFMASRLACELHRRIAAIAVVAASLNKNMDYEPTQPLPVMYIQGTADPLVPFAGGDMKKGAKGPIYGHEEVLQKWAAIDTCNNKPVITNLPDVAHDGTTVIKEEYSNPNGLKVIGYTIVNGGHAWPDSPGRLPVFIVGRPINSLDACQVIWDFFKGYRHISILYGETH